MQNLHILIALPDWLNGDKWLNLTFLFLAIFSTLLSIYLYRKGKKNKKPLYTFRSLNIISDKIHSLGNIEVTYHGNLVKNLTVTKVAVWNDGNETLNSDDQAPTDKLRIIFTEATKIFNAEVIYKSSDPNNFQAIIKENTIELSYDYLDKNQGAIIKVIHSGKSTYDLTMTGTFKGVGRIKYISIYSYPPFEHKLSILGKKFKVLTLSSYSWVNILMGILGTAAYVSSLFFYSEFLLSNIFIFIFIAFMALLSIFVFTSALVNAKRSYRLPDKFLEKFFEND